MNNYQIQVEDIVVDVVRKRIKNFYVRIYPDGRVLATASFFTSEAFIRRYITQKMPWIQSKLAQYSRQPRAAPVQMAQGEIHYFLGEPYTLNLIERTAGVRTVVRDEPAMSLSIGTGKKEELKKHLEIWYRDQIKMLLPSLLQKWERIIDVRVTGCSIKKMRSRWGSCNIQKRRISLNLDLAKKPLSCLEYVLVHELVHLHERLHNKRFWALMDKFMPNWREHDAILLGCVKT